MRDLRSIGTAHVRRRLGRSLLTASGVALGITIFFATQTAASSVQTSYDRLVDAYTGGTDVEARPVGLFGAVLPAETASRLAALPSVTGVTASLTVPASRSDGSVLKLRGIDAAAARFFEFPLAAGRLPVPGQPDLLVTAGRGTLRLGTEIEVIAPTGPRRLVVTGVMRDEGVGGLEDGSNAYSSLETAQALLGKGAVVDRVRATLAGGTSTASWVDDHTYAVPGAQLLDARDAFGSALGLIGSALSLFALVALFIGGYLIHITLSSAIVQRTTEFGTLRAVGATRKQVRRVVRAEALVVGLASTLIALVVGAAIAVPLAAQLANIADLDDYEFRFSVGAVVVSLLLGLGVSFVSALVPARRASRLSPVEAMRGDVGAAMRLSRSWVAGLVLVPLGALALAAGDTFPAFGLGVLLLLTGAVLLVPPLLGPLARAVAAVVGRVSPGAARIAVLHLVKERRRSAYVLGLVMIVLGFALGQAIAVNGFNRMVDESLDASTPDVQVLSPVPFAPAALQTIRTTPGIEVVTEDRYGRTAIVREDGEDRIDLGLHVFDPATFFRVNDLAWRDGSATVAAAALAAGGRVLMPAALAEARHLSVGDTVQLRTTAGPRPFVVAATFNGAGTGNFAPIVGPKDEALFGVGASNHVLAKVAAGASPRAVRDELRRRLQAGDDYNFNSERFNVVDRDDARAAVRAEVGGVVGIFNVLVAVIGVVGLLGLANSLVLSMLYRYREIGILRAVGTRRRQVAMGVVVEAISMVAVAAILAVPLGLLIGLGLNQATRGGGWDVTYRIPATAAVFLVTVSAAMALLAAVVPARRAARLPVVDAIRIA